MFNRSQVLVAASLKVQRSVSKRTDTLPVLKVQISLTLTLARDSSPHFNTISTLIGAIECHYLLVPESKQLKNCSCYTCYYQRTVYLNSWMRRDITKFSQTRATNSRTQTDNPEKSVRICVSAFQYSCAWCDYLRFRHVEHRLSPQGRRGASTAGDAE